MNGAVRKARESARLAADFVEASAPEIERATIGLAERFERGGKLLAFGNGGSACDASHAAVEFAHPIIERRRALPAIALSESTALLSAVGNDGDFSRVFVDQIDLLARPHDALLGISTSGASSNVAVALRRGRELGLFTIGFAGRDGGSMADLCDVCLVVPSWSIHRIQEVHTLLLHLLWDELHVKLGADDVL